MARLMILCGFLLSLPGVANAQWTCGCNTPQPARVGMFSNFANYQTASSCATGNCGVAQQSAYYTGEVVVHQPVAQTCYHTVPVTEYQQVKQVVKKPIVETKWVDQAVTEYKPVVETRTVSVPTTNYQDVTEYKTVTKNYGYWTTAQTATAKAAPCEYDNTPGLLGWMNRTGYQTRQMFTPAVTTQRQFVPQTCVQTVPVTRRVASQGTKQVSYNVTSYVPQTTTKKVAVNSVRYEDHETVAMHPVTVMRTVPIGSQMAFSPMIGGPSTTAFLPMYAAPSSQTALQPTPDTTINARRNDTTRPRTANGNDDAFGPDANPNGRGATNEIPNRRSSMNEPKSSHPVEKKVVEMRMAAREEYEYLEIPLPSPLPAAPVNPPTATRMGRWVARNPDATPTLTAIPAPLSLADADK